MSTHSGSSVLTEYAEPLFHPGFGVFSAFMARNSAEQLSRRHKDIQEMVPFFFTLAQLGYTQRLRGPLPLKAHTPVSGFILCCSQPSSNTNPPTNLNVTLNDQTRLEDSKVKLLPTDSGV